MVKNTKTAPKQVSTKTEQKAAPKQSGTIKVKEGLTFRGARQAWYDVLQKYNGKPANDFLADTTKTPPSLPKSGRPEAPSGWLRYFVRTGACTVTTAQ